MPGRATPRAVVRLIEAAVDDLARLARRDPQVVRQVLKKLLLLERDPYAGAPLVGALIGFRKLVVGDRHWRIVWRVDRDERGRTVVEVAEVWAIGARADAEVYAEVTARVGGLGDTPTARAFAEVVDLLGRAAGSVRPTTEPVVDAVPAWLVDRLVHTAGRDRHEVEAMAPEAAMQAWEAFITGRGP